MSTKPPMAVRMPSVHGPEVPLFTAGPRRAVGSSSRASRSSASPCSATSARSPRSGRDPQVGEAAHAPVDQVVQPGPQGSRFPTRWRLDDERQLHARRRRFRLAQHQGDVGREQVVPGYAVDYETGRTHGRENGRCRARSLGTVVLVGARRADGRDTADDEELLAPQLMASANRPGQTRIAHGDFVLVATLALEAEHDPTPGDRGVVAPQCPWRPLPPPVPGPSVPRPRVAPPLKHDRLPADPDSVGSSTPGYGRTPCPSSIPSPSRRRHASG